MRNAARIIRNGCFIISLFLWIGIACAEGAETSITPHSLNRATHRKSPIAICMVFRNEAPYLKEWIEFHRIVGVGHFYLYNNLSTDNYLEVLLPYIKQGIVELFDYPETHFNLTNSKYPNQVIPYNHAIKLAKKKNEWLGVIDSDEFICPVITDNLPDILEKYTYAGGLCAFWQCYGTSGVKTLMPNELMVEKLFLKLPPNAEKNRWVKSIVRVKYAHQMIDAHQCEYLQNRAAVFPNHRLFRRPIPFPELPIQEIRINHYIWRTEEYLQNVKLPRMIEQNYLPNDIQELLNACNLIADPIMERYIPRLRQAVFGKHTLYE